MESARDIDSTRKRATLVDESEICGRKLQKRLGTTHRHRPRLRVLILSHASENALAGLLQTSSTNLRHRKWLDRAIMGKSRACSKLPKWHDSVVPCLPAASSESDFFHICFPDTINAPKFV